MFYHVKQSVVLKKIKIKMYFSKFKSQIKYFLRLIMTLLYTYCLQQDGDIVLYYQFVSLASLACKGKVCYYWELDSIFLTKTGTQWIWGRIRNSHQRGSTWNIRYQRRWQWTIEFCGSQQTRSQTNLKK